MDKFHSYSQSMTSQPERARQKRLAILLLLAIGFAGFMQWKAGRQQALPLAYWQQERILEPLEMAPELLAVENSFALLPSVFELDEQGQLRIDHVVRVSLETLAELLLGAQDRAALNDLQARLQIELPVAAAQQAAALLESYLAYRHALKELDLTESIDAVIAADTELATVLALRRQYFDEPTAQALFGEEEAYWQAVVAAVHSEAEE